MRRTFLALVALGFASLAGLAEDGPAIKCLSPNHHFALQIAGPGADPSAERKVDIVEKDSGKVVLDLGTTPANYVARTTLVWSPNSTWVAYCTRGDREGEVQVFFWNGSAFDAIDLPEELPSPNINFGKDNGAVKNYGGATVPSHWLKTGDLELISDLVMLSRDTGRTYTGTVTFTIVFSPQHHASIHHVGQSKTKVDR